MPCSNILPVYRWIITFLSMYSFTAKGYTLVLATKNAPFLIWFAWKKFPIQLVAHAVHVRYIRFQSTSFAFHTFFLKIYGRSMLCAWVMLGYSFSSLLYVLPIWIVTKADISRCIPSCLTTRDQMMPFHFFLKPLLFTKFLLFFYCSDL